jgi:RHS repeat-associated protein
MVGFALNGVNYYYVRNLQGDVVGIYDNSGAVVVQYTSDTWGNVLDIWDVSGYNVGSINPIRYRGYYFDTETGYYYRQSRYYNPQWCRFISADVYLDTGDGVLGTNMYAYCDNDAVNLCDPSGTDARDNSYVGTDDIKRSVGIIGVIFGLYVMYKVAVTDGNLALAREYAEEIQKTAKIIDFPLKQLPDFVPVPAPKTKQNPPKKPDAKYYKAIPTEPGITVLGRQAMNADEAILYIKANPKNSIYASTEADVLRLIGYMGMKAETGNKEKLVKQGQNAFHYHAKELPHTNHFFYGSQAVKWNYGLGR